MSRVELLLSKSSNLFYQKSLTNHSVGGCGEEKGFKGKRNCRSRLRFRSPRFAGLSYRKIFRAGKKQRKKHVWPTRPFARVVKRSPKKSEKMLKLWKISKQLIVNLFLKFMKKNNIDRKTIINEIEKTVKIKINKSDDFIYDLEKISSINLEKYLKSVKQTKPLYHPNDIHTLLRDDVQSKCLPVLQTLQNAKVKKGDYFLCLKPIKSRNEN